MASYVFGQSAIMPQGKPFRLAIEGVDTEYELVHHLDSAGRIHMSVDRAGQASRRPMHDARRPSYIQHDIDDESAYDENGVIRDGHSVRVRLQEMRDASRNEPLVITTGLRLDREFYPDGTPKYRRDDDPQPRRRRKVQARDPQGREAGSFEEETDDHRPGHRLGDGAGRATVDAAYNAMVADLTTAWMSPEQRAQNVSDAQRGTADVPPGVSPSEWARHQRILQDADAWRTPAPTYDAGQETGSRTREIPSPPKGSVYAPVGYAAKAGDTVTFNGAPATLVERDGWLYAVMIDVGPTRSGRSSGGAPPTRNSDAMTADQGQAIKDAAWQAMVREQNEMWRTPP
jgi:hypothetical protein